EVGICRKGTSTCVDTRYTECEGAVMPRARSCASSADNDCDGSPDNTIDDTCTCVVGTTEPCGGDPLPHGIGRCRAGQQVCVAGPGNTSSAYTACQGSVPPLPADSCTVRGDDSNCNGAANDGCACVAGAGNEPCDSPTASRCDATGACVAC